MTRKPPTGERLELAPGGASTASRRRRASLARLSIRLLCGVLVIAGGAGPTFTQTPREDARFLLAGIRKERSALHSGVCRLNGYCQTRPETALTGPVRIFAAFEGGTHKIRCDKTAPGMV